MAERLTLSALIVPAAITAWLAKWCTHLYDYLLARVVA
jgi:hypothetical protein